MNPNEKQLIQDLFERLRASSTEPRDPEAEQLINSEITKSPAAAYALAQTVIVQDHALRDMHQRLQAAEADLAKAKEEAARTAQLRQPPQDDARQRYAPPGAGAADQAPAGGGFLSRLGLGGGGQSQPPAQDQGGGGGGFLRGAMQTAAGVAGGALLFQGVKSMFGGEAHASQGNAGDGFLGPWGSGDQSGEQPETVEILPDDGPGYDDGDYGDDGYDMDDDDYGSI